MREIHRQPKKWGWRARIVHGAQAAGMRGGTRWALIFGMWLPLGMVAVSLMVLSPPSTWGTAPIRYKGHAYRRGQAGYAQAAAHEWAWKRIAGPAGLALAVIWEGATLVWVIWLGGAVFRGQARAEHWACRYPLRFGPKEWSALEGIINASGLTASHGGVPSGLVGFAAPLQCVTKSHEERLRLADYLETYSQSPTAMIEHAQARPLAVSLREVGGLFYIWPKSGLQR